MEEKKAGIKKLLLIVGAALGFIIGSVPTIAANAKPVKVMAGDVCDIDQMIIEQYYERLDCDSEYEKAKHELLDIPEF